MESNPQIITFRVYFTNRKPLYTYSKNLYVVEEHIRTHGISTIHKIIFYFMNNPNYPVGIHTITLENIKSNDRFIVIFYHYYNAYNELTMLCHKQQVYDYVALLQLVCYTANLWYYIGVFIIVPLSVTQELLLNYHTIDKHDTTFIKCNSYIESII